MQLSWYELILTMGATQGLVTSILLLKQKHHPVANRYMAAALICFSLISLKYALISSGLFKTAALAYFPMAFEFSVAPFMYFYIHSVTHKNFKLYPRHYLHFVPFLIFMSYAIIVYVTVLPYPDEASKSAQLPSVYFYYVKKSEDWLNMISIFVYLAVYFSILQRYRKRVLDTVSDTLCPTFTWLRNMMFIFLVLAFIFLIALLLENLTDIGHYTNLHWKVYLVYIACTVYYIGFRAYKMAPEELAHAYLTDSEHEDNETPEPALLEQDSINQTSEKAKLSADKVETIAKAFEQRVKSDKLHLNATLSARDVAKKLQVNQSHLSFAINQYFNLSFRDYINTLRVEAVKQSLLDPANQNIAILPLALDCGFNSEASFYRIFKKFTGTAPKQFVEQMTNR